MKSFRCQNPGSRFRISENSRFQGQGLGFLRASGSRFQIKNQKDLSSMFGIYESSRFQVQVLGSKYKITQDFIYMITQDSRFSLYPGLLVPGLGFTQNSPIVPGSETPRFQVKEILRSPGSRFRNTKESRFQAQENRGLLVPGSGMLRVPGSGIPRLQVREHQGRLYAVEPIS